MNLLTLQPDQYNLLCLWSADDCVRRIVTNDDINHIVSAVNLKKLKVVKVQTKGVVAPVGCPDYSPDAQIHIVMMTRAIDGF
jgi:hypothetical protein